MNFQLEFKVFLSGYPAEENFHSNCILPEDVIVMNEAILERDAHQEDAPRAQLSSKKLNPGWPDVCNQNYCIKGPVYPLTDE